MVPPPKRVDSVEVHNTTGTPRDVTVVYDDHKESKDILETASVAPGSKHLFGSKELDFGSYKAVAPVKHVKVVESGYEHALELQVTGIVKVLSVSLTEVDGKPQLKQT